MELKAVVFDFDGVCIDTEMARYISWQRIYARFSLELPKNEWLRNIGKTIDVFDPYQLLVQLVGTTPDKEKILALHREQEVEIANEMPLQPGLIERLDEAESCGIICAIASSSSHRWVDGHLRYRGIFERFAVTICREDTTTHKPHSEPYLAALRKIGIDSDHAIAIEDSPLGIEAARSAGLFCIGIPCSMTKDMDLTVANMLAGSLHDISFATIDRIIAQRKGS